MLPDEHDRAAVERSAQGQLPTTVPAVLHGTQVRVATRPVGWLQLLPDATLELKLFVRAAPGTPLYALGAGPRDVMFLDGGSWGTPAIPTTSTSLGARSSMRSRAACCASPVPCSTWRKMGTV